MTTERRNCKRGSLSKDLGQVTTREKSNFTIQQVMGKLTDDTLVSLFENNKGGILEIIKDGRFTHEDIQVLAPLWNTLVDFTAKETAKENENLKTLSEQTWQAYNKETDLQGEILANKDLSPELKRHCFDELQKSKDSKKEMNENREDNANSNKRYLITGVVTAVVGLGIGLIWGRSQKK